MSTKHKSFTVMDAAMLRERGWTNTMIRDFLGDPDTKRQTQMAGAMRPVDAWLRSRVTAVESTPEFAKRAARAGRALVPAVTMSRESALDRAGSVPVELRAIPPAVLEQAAVMYMGIRVKSTHIDIARAKVNYLRHECSNYDMLWQGMADLECAQEVHDVLHDRVLDSIREMYPDLSSECDRQRKRVTV